MPARDALFHQFVHDPLRHERRAAADAELDELAREGIIGTEMLMDEQLVKENKRAAG